MNKKVTIKNGYRPKRQREGGDQYFKEVAITPDGRMVSVFDGETEYVIGKEMKQRALQDHGGGYYCYGSKMAALFTGFPFASKAFHLPRALIRVRAEGSYCRYSGALAFSRLTPLEIIESPGNGRLIVGFDYATTA